MQEMKIIFALILTDMAVFSIALYILKIHCVVQPQQLKCIILVLWYLANENKATLHRHCTLKHWTCK